MAGRHDQEFERQLYKVPLGLRSPVNIHAFSSYQKKDSFMLLQFIIYCSEDRNFIILHEYKTGEG